VYQPSELFRLPKELLDIVVSYLSYRDAIVLKDICSTLHAAVDVPTVESFFLEPKWFTNVQGKQALTGVPIGNSTWQPCHVCKRFLPQSNFAANQVSDTKVFPSMHKGSKHHFQRWCLACGLAAGVYAPGQYIFYRSPWSGIVRGRFCMCGTFLRAYKSCRPDDKCTKCAGDKPSFRVQWAAR